MTKEFFATSTKAALCGALLVALGACSDMSSTQQRVVSGAGIGALGGAAVTGISGGCVSCGAAIGAGAGAVGGYIVDQNAKH